MSYIQYVNALHSKKTKEKYTEFLNAFLTYADNGCDEILQMEPKQVQSLLIQYIIDMRDKMKLAPNSMKVRLASIKTFFQLNDFDGINWFKVKPSLFGKLTNLLVEFMNLSTSSCSDASCMLLLIVSELLFSNIQYCFVHSRIYTLLSIGNVC